MSFDARFRALFDAHFERIARYLDRVSGDADLAADLAQETFVRLYRRGAEPGDAEAWLITVAMNLFRNAVSTRARRGRILAGRGGERWQADPPPPPDREPGAGAERRRAAAALRRLSERERDLLLLRAEGYAYRDLALALGLHEASVGTLLARARERFREAYHEASDD